MTSVIAGNEDNQPTMKGDFAEIISALSSRYFWNTC